MDINANAIISLLKYLKNFYPKIKNLLTRPKLTITIEIKPIVFHKNDKITDLSYICLIVRNTLKETISLYPKNIKINNEPYGAIISNDRNYQELEYRLTCCENEVFSNYKKNWAKIQSNDFYFKLGKDQEIIFPINISKEWSRSILDIKKESMILFSTSNCCISIPIGINKKIYEYEVNRKEIYEKCIRYLAWYNL